MIGLRPNGLGGRLFERNVLLQRLVKGFDVPLSAVERHDLFASEAERTKIVSHVNCDALLPSTNHRINVTILSDTSK